ncbi:tRNA-splicing endonuclease subunit Sen34 isoform X3 [Mus musculus]|nr:tRNA-splicing endonuclease subunit Sen34 isoform d [Mus musculus]NP_001406981.1 tRNA-splicing endonuclease subunit Sen34 isoform d [Mus musculus]XP_036009228.1 tRNA-splicing endonuclease subunit Sen34 isoform X3 [Mus musculus]XP_036009230.1 tRNA-splicing endonuclease subunit Sen34 isoform X3 [Mus musculus]XP_036009231.1 tRNA-splicing endonuclease subunit Sen34 isoform X3 [Mus musculus]XP_036009232.1 tRNA-splicing endonuclease subunit Sen34 isoform X3 [Mus musculus]XP_036009233.1 tRNA-splic
MLVVEVANGRSLVWGAEAVQALRERLGVGGRTVGALPRGPRQNSRLGLPLLLLPEEARLLAEIGAVTLVSAPRPDPRNHGLALASFKRQQEQSFQDQNTLAAEARETRRQELLEKIVEGQAAKKQKLEQDSGADEGGQEAGGSEATQGSETSDDGQPSAEQEGAAPSLDSSSPQPGPSNGVTPLPRSALLIQLATARPRPVKAKPLDWRVQSKDWPHAGRPAHELRYSIYRDLWERGFFLSAAGKFGGDFLVYPGDLKQDNKYARILLNSWRVVLSNTGSLPGAKISLEFAIPHRVVHVALADLNRVSAEVIKMHKHSCPALICQYF